VKPTDTIATIKGIIEGLEDGVDANALDLTFDGDLLADDKTVADYEITSFAVVMFETTVIKGSGESDFGSGIFTLESVQDEKGALTLSTVVGVCVLLLVILILVPLLVYRQRKRAQNTQREELSDIFATAYRDKQPFIRFPSHSKTQYTATETELSDESSSVGGGDGGRFNPRNNPKSFFDKVFERFDLQPVIFTDEALSIASDDQWHNNHHGGCGGPMKGIGTDDESIYESARDLQAKKGKAKGNKGSFNLSGNHGGDSDTDVGSPTKSAYRNGVFEFRMTSAGTDEAGSVIGDLPKKKKKKLNKKKNQNMNIGKRVLQPQWFHGDVAKPPVDDGLMFDDSEMFVADTTPPPKKKRESRLQEAQSTGYSEVLPTPQPPPRRKMGPPAFFDQGYAMPEPPPPRARYMSVEGFEDLEQFDDGKVEMHIDMFSNGDGYLDTEGMPRRERPSVVMTSFNPDEGGYMDTEGMPHKVRKGHKTKKRAANGVVGEYLSTVQRGEGEYMIGIQRGEGEYLSPGDDGRGEYLSPEPGDEYFSPNSNQRDSGEYLHPGGRDGYGEGEYLQNGDGDEYIDGGIIKGDEYVDTDGSERRGTPSFDPNYDPNRPTSSDEEEEGDEGGEARNDRYATQFSRPRDGGRALPDTAVALNASLPSLNEISAMPKQNFSPFGASGFARGGLSGTLTRIKNRPHDRDVGALGITSPEMDWVSSQWDKVNDAAVTYDTMNTFTAGMTMTSRTLPRGGPDRIRLGTGMPGDLSSGTGTEGMSTLLGAGSEFVKSNPLFEDLSDMSDVDSKDADDENDYE
jgi:hypothetical protein